VAYADPPYPGLAHYYRDQPEYHGEVDHAALARALAMFDGWVLHTHVPALAEVDGHLRAAGITGYRICAWVKPFASFKPGVSPAYAWEPVFILSCRKPAELDWVSCPIVLRKGFIGAKPAELCRWAFELVGLDPSDDFIDLFPGSGAVTEAWHSWRSQLQLTL
jgi:hypothetical protein